MIPIDELQPSVENDEIYGAIDQSNPDFIDLVLGIEAKGIKEAIRVSKDMFVISGHRRLAAAKRAGLTEVPVIIEDVARLEFTPTGWKVLLVEWNRQRVKSSAMRMRETLLTIDPELAHERLIEAREVRIGVSLRPWNRADFDTL